MRALRCDQTADGPRGALRRAVALHADDGVADAKAGLTVFAEVDEHIGKISGLWIFIVILRLHCAGNDAEKVFDGVRHAHHAVRFELADVDDRVSLLQICRHRKASGLRCFRIRDRADGKIRVKLRAERLGVQSDALWLLCETSLDEILAATFPFRSAVCASAQTAPPGATTASSPSSAG